jgi:hypothetical protein
MKEKDFWEKLMLAFVLLGSLGVAAVIVAMFF